MDVIDSNYILNYHVLKQASMISVTHEGGSSTTDVAVFCCAYCAYVCHVIYLFIVFIYVCLYYLLAYLFIHSH